MTSLAASLFAADPLRLLEEIEAVTPYVESFHLDIMDGAFAPEFGLSGRLVGDLRQVTAKPLDVHLMVGDPRGAIIRYAEAGVRSIAVHIEGGTDFAEASAIVRANGGRLLVAIRHTTPVVRLNEVSEIVDGILFMTAPLGGGAFDDNAFDRLAERPRHLSTTVDGRIEARHFQRLADLGVDLAVMGAALFADGEAAEMARRYAAELAVQEHTSRIIR
jgi:ribulose-phosphate 3-epimerase